MRFLIMYLAAFTAIPAHAFSVSPMHVELESVGRAARSSASISNTGSHPIAVEPRVSAVKIDADGKVTTVQAGAENFLIVPQQAFIQPGTTQTFRIMWVGNPTLAQSESYLISFDQLAVAGMSTSGVNVLMSFGLAVNIKPPAAKAALSITATALQPVGKGLQPVITVNNDGQAHALLRDSTITVATGAMSHTISSEQISKAFGTGLIQPGKQRRFPLPITLPAGTSSIRATIVNR